jgi:hypothetical protein
VLLTGSCGCGKTVGLLMAGLLDVDRPGHRALLVQRTLAGPVSQDSGASGKSVIPTTEGSWPAMPRPAAASVFRPMQARRSSV